MGKLIKTVDLFDLSHTAAAPLLTKTTYPHEALPHIGDFIKGLAEGLSSDEYDQIGEGVYIAKDVKIAKTATIEGPCIIGRGTEVRPGAYIRGNALIGEGCVIGNSTEIKNAILFDGVQVPHYNYVGDSILGYRSHMGAGVICSNVRGDKKPVTIHGDDEKIETGLKKVGAMLGDYAEIGCNSVLCPGVIIGRGAQTYPLCRVRGVLGEGLLLKGDGTTVKRIL